MNLAKRVVADGEGSSKFITININDAKTDVDAKKIAFSIGNSPLVKTAISGEDPNWGRVVMAIGKSQASIKIKRLAIKFGKICVVEDIADQWSIENSNVFKGYFHILGGTIASAGHRKEDLLINSLVERVSKNKIDEVILATSATVEGQTTAYYIQDSLKKTNAKITKLAQGLPVGGEIESLDDGTLFSAFKNRSNLKSNSD